MKEQEDNEDIAVLLVARDEPVYKQVDLNFERGKKKTAEKNGGKKSKSQQENTYFQLW